MAQNKNVELIVAELDSMAEELEAKGSVELASIVDEVAAELMVESSVKAPKAAAKAPKAKAKAKELKAPKAAKGNNKRRKTQKSKKAKVAPLVSRAEAKKILKAAHLELVDIASELLKDKDIKSAASILRYAEEVKNEEEDLDKDPLTSVDGVEDEGLEGADEGDDLDLDGEDEGEVDDADDDDDDDDLSGVGDDDADDNGVDITLPAADEAGPDEEDDLEKEVEAMLRKYDLDKEAPSTPAVPELSKPPVSDAPPAADDDKDDNDDDSDDDSDDSDDSDDGESDDDKDDKDDGDKVASTKLFELAKKLAKAGETKLAYGIADLLDRQAPKK